MNIAFEIPGLRLKGGLNAREHWRARASRAAKERKLTTIFMRESWPKSKAFSPDPWLSTWLPLAITITRVGPRKLDDDNLAGSAKHVRDAISKGIGLDDGDANLCWLYRQEKGRYSVSVSIQSNAKVEQKLVPA